MVKHIIASHGIAERLAGGYLGSYLDCMNLVNQFSFTLSKSDLKWLRYDYNGNIKMTLGICGRLANG